ncbi:MAG: L-seryl-tRNA(Sec) selenium transferase [Gemmatimonadota bacterium]
MTAAADDPRRRLPPMDELLRRDRVRGWIQRWGRAPVRSALRATLDEERDRLTEGGSDGAGAKAYGLSCLERLLDAAARRLEASARPSLRRVLNGTGVVLHTNLGRAPLAESAREAVFAASLGYTNLEFDLESGARGRRVEGCRELLRTLTRAEDALVVNNNAAAVSLAVNEFASGRDVLIARGELVEIGGSFRIPEVVERSGARLRGVGTTNRTRLSDFRDAVGKRAGLLVKVHPSNYRVEGFTGEVSLEELVGLGRELEVPVLHDLGSGLLDPETLPGFPFEPVPSGSIAAGADLVTWSGDKLLGGPQAGLVVGSSSAVSRMRNNPLARAFRVGKMTLAALEATLLLHRDPEVAASRVPAARALREEAESVEQRARSAAAGVERIGDVDIEVRAMRSMVGGGAFPTLEIPSWGWAARGADAEAIHRACRGGSPTLVGRIEDATFLVDVRTLLPGEEQRAMAVLRAAAGEVGTVTT